MPYYCYLLKSHVTEQSSRTYVGFTTQPLRRLRQHNGEIKGGARKTSRHRPWSHILVISGFPNKIVALQFEWQFQHPTVSRVLKHDAARLKNNGGYKYKMNVLLALLSTPLWKQLRLKVHFFDHKAYQYFTKLSQRYDSHTFFYEQCNHEALSSMGKIDKRHSNFSVGALSCVVCQEGAVVGAMWSCPSCAALTHVICSAKSSGLIPTKGVCQACGICLAWVDVISRRVDVIAGEEEESCPSDIDQPSDLDTYEL